jgi:hypothetical protein
MAVFLRRYGWGLWIVLALACAGPKTFLLRGEIDRDTGLIHACDSGESYGVVLASNQAFLFDDLEIRADTSEAEDPVVVEFDAVPLLAPLSSAEHRTVGVRGSVTFTKGNCASAR